MLMIGLLNCKLECQSGVLRQKNMCVQIMILVKDIDLFYMNLLCLDSILEIIDQIFGFFAIIAQQVIIMM